MVARRRPALLLAGVALLSACGSATPVADPATLLRQAKATVDAATALHFELTSAGAAGGGTTILGGSGDAARPDRLRGSFTVSVSNLPVTVRVLAGGGRFFVQAPFSTTFTATDPTTYGIGDPAKLIDPTAGLSSILPALTGVHDAGATRIGSEVVEALRGTLPGTRLPVLPDAAPSQPVAVEVDVVRATHQIRRMVLRGPFTSVAPSDYTVVLSGYGEAVQITTPAG